MRCYFLGKWDFERQLDVAEAARLTRPCVHAWNRVNRQPLLEVLETAARFTTRAVDSPFFEKNESTVSALIFNTLTFRPQERIFSASGRQLDIQSKMQTEDESPGRARRLRVGPRDRPQAGPRTSFTPGDDAPVAPKRRGLCMTEPRADIVPAERRAGLRDMRGQAALHLRALRVRERRQLLGMRRNAVPQVFGEPNALDRSQLQKFLDQRVVHNGLRLTWRGRLRDHINDLAGITPETGAKNKQISKGLIRHRDFEEFCLRRRFSRYRAQTNFE
jgi:hypothetical protein